ncbi:hypothetical protein AQ731_29925 [Burkholderia pseudomallei]|nr:conserved hypothetical protein [Burkholderia pseudomallei 576]OMR81672.1 hypothetical protein AQ731_29925 [Burkholderia pseudomallei]OMS52853.1 hypothetical protein AQ741_10820 [Burkholderia pseudomallei]OMS91369.1 hypothetical protein AQ749_29905 [Burkholderia pseudomallei]OMW18139.1 hypothetical protein AQ804_24600 [Burkholderia pseudomallei]
MPRASRVARPASRDARRAVEPVSAFAVRRSSFVGQLRRVIASDRSGARAARRAPPRGGVMTFRRAAASRRLREPARPPPVAAWTAPAVRSRVCARPRD